MLDRCGLTRKSAVGTYLHRVLGMVVAEMAVDNSTYMIDVGNNAS